MSLNRATIIGYLGQDLELRNLPTNGQPVVSFAVATDESFTDKDGNRQERVDWHRVVVYGKLAETCHKYWSKGRQLYVEGRLRTREYGATMPANVIAPRSLRSGCSFLVRDPIYPRMVRAKNPQRPKTHHSRRFANENARVTARAFS
jgi:hypothetical protein